MSKTRIRRMRKFWLVLALAMGCLLVASLWEYSLSDWSVDSQIGFFQERLHAEEKYLDEQLQKLDENNQIPKTHWRMRNSILLGFRDGKLVFWSDERAGSPNLYERLRDGGELVKVNNLYFDVRKRFIGDMEYYALLFIKEDYPYSSTYVKNHFNPRFGGNLDDATKVTIKNVWEEGGYTIYNRDGKALFKIESNVGYGDTLPNYFLLVLYFVFLYLLFYAYEISLDRSSCFREQLWHASGFFALLLLLRYVMVRYQVPYTLYHLSIFANSKVGGNGSFIVSVGDLFVSMFCLAHYLFITFNKLRIKYNEPRLMRYRFVFLVGFVLAAFFYTNMLHFSINMLIESTSVSLNIARLINVDFSSVVAFVTLIIAGMGFIVLINSSVRYFRNLFTMKQALLGVMVVIAFCAALCYFFNFSLTPLECLFTLSLFLLFILGIYLMKLDTQKSIFMMALLVVCVYIIFLAKSSEMQREQKIRSSYVVEIVKEVDPVFEEKLIEINDEIKKSTVVDSLVKVGNEKVLATYISEELLDMTGFYYDCEAIICNGRDTILVTPQHVKFGCYDYYDGMIDTLGNQVGSTSFYNIDRFDGQNVYLGRFMLPYEGICLYIRFASKKGHEGIGYVQVLSRETALENEFVYPYSYAKYRKGVLVEAKGSFNYPRTVDRFGSRAHARTVNIDGYSHMIVPVGDEGVCIVSLADDVFSLYYMNLLYAIFVSAILTSYGMFFRFDGGWGNFRQTSLKSRIKSNIISLVAGLFVLMTLMIIVGNAKSFERRHSEAVIQLSKYITSELERYNCVDADKCPEIETALKRMSDVLWVDINIYGWNGELVATSRPMIFEKGFDGTLLNPEAFKEIVRKEQMSFVQDERIAEMVYMAVYMPLVLETGEKYVLSIPYFTKGEELNKDIFLIVIIAVNIAMIVMVLAFILSSVVAERITKPLQVVNEKLRRMRVGGKNEKIIYNQRDEIGLLVKEYNEMVDKLDANVKQLAKSERESAWREMARQIAHEIKNPLTPMKLNLQFMQRTLQKGDIEEVRQRFKDISSVLIEQIDHMASIASAFSDFAKLQVANNEWFDLSELVGGCAKLFHENVTEMTCDIEPGVFVYGDREQVNRVIVNLLKNAEQSIPEDREGLVFVQLKTALGKIILLVRDNGCGIPESIKDRISEPNFTTKSGGTGLGLAMSYKIIESMGGTVSFESEENEGTTFYVTLRHDKDENN